MPLKLHRVLELAPYKIYLLVPLCYLSGVHNPELLGLKTGALTIYFSPDA